MNSVMLYARILKVRSEVCRNCPKKNGNYCYINYGDALQQLQKLLKSKVELLNRQKYITLLNTFKCCEKEHALLNKEIF